ncbi:MAG: DEAD/DEAH box helicase [Candidatus Omnitrophica bacterium]|nr:DEAD/DEAH box helicase [Candidatus Omnitrophota bacterium]
MKYDPFQQEAIDYITGGHSVIVSAPTGAGKTVIAEHVINDCLKNNTRVIYTAPIKALSNQKFRDFQVPFKDKIGILTGDVSINPHAPVLIMTTEIFRNKVLEDSHDLEGYSWIIFDEIHYIDDFERGTVWEESLIFLPPHMKMLALSATIPNIDEFADWIHSIHKRPLKVVKEDSRPVPLHFFYQYQGSILDNLKKIRASFPTRPRSYYRRGRRTTAPAQHIKPNRLDTLIKDLEKNDRLPCIYFAFGRRRCEYLADEMIKFDFLSREEKEKISEVYRDLCARFDLSGEKSAAEMRPLIERGIAYHHAGMLPTLKEVIERLFTSRLIKVIFTTETFALGINMPARTVIFDELRKFYGRHFANLKTRDFYQMAGRAGRRGIDTEGFVFSRINPGRLSIKELVRIIYGEPEKVRSRFNASYATILNLYEKYGNDLYEIYTKSLHYFQEKKERRQKAVQLMHAKVDLLEEMGYIGKDGLTEKGKFASQIYGYELPLSEMYCSGYLEGLSVNDLAMLAVALVYEPRKGAHMPKLNKPASRLKHETDGLMARIHRKELRSGILTPSKPFFYHLTPSIAGWMNKEDFDEILRRTDTDEGEVIRYFRMAVQVLREIFDTPASDELKDRVHKAVSLINRDIIDAEKQLRIL